MEILKDLMPWRKPECQTTANVLLEAELYLSVRNCHLDLATQLLTWARIMELLLLGSGTSISIFGVLHEVGHIVHGFGYGPPAVTEPFANAQAIKFIPIINNLVPSKHPFKKN
jgi:hypothetical protein